MLALNFLAESVERRAEFLSIRAAAGGRGAHRRAAPGRRRQAQGGGHHRRAANGAIACRGVLAGVDAARRHAARQRPLRDRPRGFLRHHQADPAGARGSRESRPRIARRGFRVRRRQTAGAARLIMPQLKFNYAGDMPVYSTSDSFEPDPSANSDLDGMFFPDMPWMVSADPVTDQIRDSVRAAWPARTARRDRLYAFGFDAYRLVPALRSEVPRSGQRDFGGDRQAVPRRPKSNPPRARLGADAGAAYP